MQPPTVHVAKGVKSETAALQRAIAQLGWPVTPDPCSAGLVWGNWTSDNDVDENEFLEPGQLINRFPGAVDCCRKAVFAQLFFRLRRLLPPDSALSDGRYVPQQWALPVQHAALQEHVAAAATAARGAGKSAPVYIVKPSAGSHGDGIKLTLDPARKRGGPSRVVQEYVGRPMLLGGLKFDLRLYVLVTSAGGEGDLGPLRAFRCRDGLARFATQAYESPSAENLRNVHAHLTNYSLNKAADGFKLSESADGGEDGSKRAVSAVLSALHDAGRIPSVVGLWAQIDALLMRALGVMQPLLAASRVRWEELSCFQLLGFDVLLDESGAPWLLEINSHPSLSIDGPATPRGRPTRSPVDEATKVPMLRDALKIAAAVHGVGSVGGGAEGAKYGDFGRSRAGVATHGTSFVELEPAATDLRHTKLLGHLRTLFDRHTSRCRSRSSAAEVEPGSPAREAESIPGPRWTQGTWARFLQAAGFLGSALKRTEADGIYCTVCGKGGTMNVLDFAEACALVASRLYPLERASGAPAAELLDRLVDEALLAPMPGVYQGSWAAQNSAGGAVANGAVSGEADRREGR